MLTSIDVKFIFDNANNTSKILPNLVTSRLVMVNYACAFNQSESGKYLFIYCT